MPTKDELATFAADHGIDVPASALKSDYEAAIAAAGYDPDTLEAPEAEPMSEDELTPEEAYELSRQAHFSTYSEAPAPKDAANPPDGPSVLQELGKPTEGAVTRFGE